MEKRVRFTTNRGAPATSGDGPSWIRYGILEGDSVYETPTSWSHERERRYNLRDARLLPPCWPSKIVCVGRNYQDHAKELNNEVPSEPLLFLKPPSSLAAPGDPIVFPAMSQLLHHEGELGVIIGRQARHVSEQRAMDYVFGYTCVNDVTARDLQRKDVQFTRGKGFDTFCPVGPWMVLRDDLDLTQTRVRTYVNDELKQDGAVTSMIFPIPALVSFISQVMTLEPGDLIATGTPAGVGPLQPGNVVRVEVTGIGELENPVVAAASGG
jgi:2-keto-4-pentenoate hydratase/2-oxohepta-3-ene-1,7-dioic acid hydratase in catechol pathway